MDEKTRCSTTSEQTTQPSVAWTAREALACAYCWSEFIHPEETMSEDTPEAYWLRINERARNDCRRIASDLLLLAVARGQAVAMLPPDAWKQEKLDAFSAAARLVSVARRWELLTKVYRVLKTSPQTVGGTSSEAPNTESYPNTTTALR